MNELLESFIAKLPEVVNRTPLQLKGIKVDSKFNQLKLIVPDISKSKLTGLAVLLQNISIDLFTIEELTEVSKLPLHYLDTVIIPHKSIGNPINPIKPLYDTGSSRVYTKLDTEDITTATLYLGFAAYNSYSVNDIKELVIALYNKGF